MTRERRDPDSLPGVTSGDAQGAARLGRIETPGRTEWLAGYRFPRDFRERVRAIRFSSLRRRAPVR
jgi:hypothetical protein